MSSAVKSIKKGLSSAWDTTKDALSGDLGSIVQVGSLGMSNLATKPIEKVGSEAKEALLPDMPDVNIPEQPTQGASPSAVQTKGANVDIGATEGMRRRTGSAKGSRKLRVPLGGLGR